MRVVRSGWTAAEGWLEGPPEPLPKSQLLFVFGSREALTEGLPFEDLRRAYPNAQLMGCSTSGEIHDTRVRDDSIAATAVEFEHSRVERFSVELTSPSESASAGRKIGSLLPPEGLVHVFVLSEGLNVNGSDLVKGLREGLPEHVTITGGLSGDADRFDQTLVLDEGAALSNRVTAIGLYGDRLQIGCASLGGWDPFGPERVVTRSEGNVLHELDGQSALGLYQEYLGDHAANLPASGLLFPLAVRLTEDTTPVVRTVLATDDASQTMTFAGDLPEGSHAQLMMANFDRLVSGAEGAARVSNSGFEGAPPQLALLISCVGRKMVLKQRVEEEVEAVRRVFGPSTALTGFYSYGEISPFSPTATCELHNQTMTITAISEA